MGAAAGQGRHVQGLEQSAGVICGGAKEAGGPSARPAGPTCALSAAGKSAPLPSAHLPRAAPPGSDRSPRAACSSGPRAPGARRRGPASGNRGDPGRGQGCAWHPGPRGTAPRGATGAETSIRRLTSWRGRTSLRGPAGQQPRVGRVQGSTPCRRAADPVRGRAGSRLKQFAERSGAQRGAAPAAPFGRPASPVQPPSGTWGRGSTSPRVDGVIGACGAAPRPSGGPGARMARR